MEQKPSKFTPINVIIWCCVAVFVAVTVAAILSIFDIGIVDPEVKPKLYTLVIVEVAAIGIAVFGRAVAEKKSKDTAPVATAGAG